VGEELHPSRYFSTRTVHGARAWQPGADSAGKRVHHWVTVPMAAASSRRRGVISPSSPCLSAGVAAPLTDPPTCDWPGVVVCALVERGVWLVLVAALLAVCVCVWLLAGVPILLSGKARA
jgi:hypothetical protein